MLNGIYAGCHFDRRLAHLRPHLSFRPEGCAPPPTFVISTEAPVSSVEDRNGGERRNLPSQGSPANNASPAIRHDCQTSHAKLLNNVILEGPLFAIVLDLVDYAKQSWF
jgi:hypothetical protein